MAAPAKPDIRGERREELVWDLAQGALTHAELAAKYDRHVQAIAQFSVRNRGEIAVVQAGNNRALHERLAEIPIADKARRIAVDQVLRDDLLGRLESEDLEPRLRNHYTKTIMALQRAVAEELGDLRATVDLTTTGFDLPPVGTRWGPIAAPVSDVPEQGSGHVTDGVGAHGQPAVS